jgi:cellulose synthase/poly-beta-1,6-N-acetylglucosamine synthase-like glycosyltransferase
MENERAKMEELNDLRHLPPVSVWVAARNEEKNLHACLQHLVAQDYAGQWEVRIADDGSQDSTFRIAAEFSAQYLHFHALRVPTRTTFQTRGKALAMGLLAQESAGEIYLFCDADMCMPPNWIGSMVHAMQTMRADLINGTTCTNGRTFFSALQAIDWLLPQATFSWLSRLDITYTAMGNNMGISKKAYWATGGYLQLPFSITEDFELFRHARLKGYRLIHHYDFSVLGISEPEHSWSEWLQQHIRWMVGFMQLPLSQRWIFYIQLLLYPLIFSSGFLFPEPVWQTAWGLFGLKLLYEGWMLSRVKQFHLLPYLPVYQLIWWPFYMACLLGYHLAGQISWKGRLWDKG